MTSRAIRRVSRSLWFRGLLVFLFLFAQWRPQWTLGLPACSVPGQPEEAYTTDCASCVVSTNPCPGTSLSVPEIPTCVEAALQGNEPRRFSVIGHEYDCVAEPNWLTIAAAIASGGLVAGECGVHCATGSPTCISCLVLLAAALLALGINLCAYISSCGPDWDSGTEWEFRACTPNGPECNVKGNPNGV